MSTPTEVVRVALALLAATCACDREVRRPAPAAPILAARDPAALPQTSPSPSSTPTPPAAPEAARPSPTCRLAGALDPTPAYLTATLLADGRVLVAGGQEHDHDGPYHAEASILDPAAGTIAAARPLATRRGWHSAIRLQDGRVLAVGGESDVRPTLAATALAEVFDPATGRWTPAGALSVPRLSPALALLPNGRVVAAGGYLVPDGDFAAADLFDPRTGRWSPLPAMPVRLAGRAVALADGRVLVAGTVSLDFDRDGALLVLDPARRRWSTVPAGAHRYPVVALGLADGRVVVVGETDVPRETYAELRDARLDHPTAVATPPVGPQEDLFDLELLAAGDRLLALGGEAVFVWSPRDDRWREIARLARPRFNARAVLLAGGTAVAVVGGAEVGPGLPVVAQVEICDLPRQTPESGD